MSDVPGKRHDTYRHHPKRMQKKATPLSAKMHQAGVAINAVETLRQWIQGVPEFLGSMGDSILELLESLW